MAEGLGYLHANNKVHGSLDGVGVFFEPFRTSPVTPGQYSILIDHDGHARLADFELLSIDIVYELSSAKLKSGYRRAFVAPEILEGADAITPEADVFAFGMLVIEVDPRPVPHR